MPPKKPRLTAQDSRQILIETCLDLLAEHPVGEITNRRLEQASGLNQSYVTRYFGNQKELFLAVITTLEQRIAASVTTTGEMDVVAILTSPDARLRLELTQWLLANDVPPERFVGLEAPLVAHIAARIAVVFGLGERAARIVAYQMLMVGQAFVLLGDTIDLDEQTLSDLFDLIRAQTQLVPEIERTLRW